MTRVKPYSGKSVDRLTGIIKAANPKANETNISFDFGLPASAPNAYLNTRVFVRPVYAQAPGAVAIPPGPFEEIQYRRLSLEVLHYLPACEVFPVTGLELPFSIHEQLDKINDALGLDLQPEEVVNHRYTHAAATYRLEIANDNNLAWLKSSYDFEAEVGVEHNVRTLESGALRLLEEREVRTLEPATVAKTNVFSN